MEKIKISDHPTAGYVRYAEVVEKGMSYRQKIIALVIEITHYKEKGASDIIIENKDVSLIATRDTWLDAQGNIVPKEQGVVTEYDYLEAFRKEPVILNDMYLDYILKADERKQFDKY